MNTGKTCKEIGALNKRKKKLKIALFCKNIIENIKEYIEHTILIRKNLRKRNLKNGLKKLNN